MSASRGGAAIALLLAASAAPLALRPRLSRWGATREDVRPLPGDDLVVRPMFVSTRAVTMDAPPAAVWPWLVQLGQGRGGLYSYDRLENLFGLDIHSAARIVPELQRLEVGDRISLGKCAHMVVHAVEPERALVLRHPDGGWSWSFVLEPLANRSTRLTVRNRWTTERTQPAERLGPKVAELPAFVMERKMLLRLKQRAEGTP